MSRDRAMTALRQGRAVDLRMQGHDYDSIAKELGYADRSGAWRAVNRALDARRVTAVDRYRMVRYAELEVIHRHSQAAADAGDLQAVSACLAAAAERIRLLRLC